MPGRERFLDTQWYRVANLRPRMRGHVQVHRHRYHGSAWYVAHDEIGGRQYRFTPATYLFIGLMDGRGSVHDIWNDVVSKIGDDAPTQGEVIRLLAQLHAADLIQCDVSPDASELFQRFARHARRSIYSRFGNPLSIKIRLFDPDRFLERTMPVVAPLLGRGGLILWIAAVVPALVLALMHWAELSDNFTDQVLATENLMLVGLIYPFVKALHELGHGYATKLLGGAVHELGVMLLVFMPVPYVDASASAAFRSKWHRALVGAAGMFPRSPASPRVSSEEPSGSLPPSQRWKLAGRSSRP